MTLNREQRRKLQRATKREVGSDGVLLSGGPMNGWYVTADAPALTRTWGRAHGGYYQRRQEAIAVVQTADWVSTVGGEVSRPASA